MEPITAGLTILNGMISTAFNLYKLLKMIAGDVKIPSWNEILKKNTEFQDIVDGEGK